MKNTYNTFPEGATYPGNGVHIYRGKVSIYQSAAADSARRGNIDERLTKINLSVRRLRYIHAACVAGGGAYLYQLTSLPVSRSTS